MHLHTLLKDRASINILKILYDNEAQQKRYTMSYVDMKDRLAVPETPFTIPNLEKAELITTEKSEAGQLYLSITQKGKEFITQFDKIVAIMHGKKEEPKAYQVEYNLTQMEQRILVLCSKIKSETGSRVPLKTLTQEVYPYTEPSSRSGTVSKYAKKLEELNLIERKKKSNRTFFDITDTGERVIKEQFMNIATPNAPGT